MSVMDWGALAACKDADPALFDPDDDMDWRDLARCTEVDPAIFFPGKGENGSAAKKVCARCEVRDACLDYALKDPSLAGVWGGTSDRERQRIRMERRLPVITVAPDPDDTKVCAGPCGQGKPLTGFSIDRSTPDGHKQRCKTCMAEQQRRSRAAA